MALYFSKVKIEKRFLTEIAIVVGIVMCVYGLILTVQPDDEKYVKFTKTTITKENNSTK